MWLPEFNNVCATPKLRLWASPCTLAPAAWNTSGKFTQSRLHFPRGLKALEQPGPPTGATELPVHGVLDPPLQNVTPREALWRARGFSHARPEGGSGQAQSHLAHTAHRPFTQTREGLDSEDCGHVQSLLQILSSASLARKQLQSM